MLFNKRLLQQNIEKFNFPCGEEKQKIDEIIAGWQIAFKDHDLSKAKETSLQGKFFAKFFCETLGYSTQDEGLSEWTLKQEAKTEVDGKEADGSLGFYTKNNEQTRVVIELKDAQTNLDKKQNRDSKLTPIEQAFQYSFKTNGVDWIIVSNFQETRLYHKTTGQTAHETFNVLTLHEEKEFKRFYFTLCKENLIDKNKNSVMDKLIKQSSEQEKDITNEFYSKFKKTRKTLFEHICEMNPQYNKKLLLEKTQKLLDRFIFVYFCEDTAGLLPVETVSNIYKNALNSFSMVECRIWEQFKGLFRSIDKGNPQMNINAYNGGLFAYDEILDTLIIQDAVFSEIKALAEYDFESDLNENILGHIFEQSLSDIEIIKNEIDGVTIAKNKGKRKIDGIHYTPEYITHYIVENSIGKFLEENPDKLSTLKILDSSCGSGAFLNQAHAFLRKQYKIQVDEKIATSTGKNLNLFEHTNIVENDRTILLNNLFGIDINPESTEITKLALWLKTANKTEPLQNLDKNIKCGNSLLFNWQDEQNNGKFDVIIGNPPYIKEYTNKQAFNGLHDSPYYQGKMDLWTLFACQAIDKLNEGGYLSFIAPNSWLTNAGASIFRNKILKEGEILKYIDFGDFKVFKDAGIQTMIFVFKKCTPRESYDVEYCKVDDKSLGEDIIKGFVESDLSEQITGITQFKATIKPKELENKNIAFLNSDIDIIIGKIKNNSNITYFNDKEVAQGIVGAPDDCFIIKDINKFNNEERTYIKEYYTSVGRYEKNKTNKRIFYICESNFKNKQINDYPNILEHFEQFKTILIDAKERYKTPNKPYFYLHRERDEKFFATGEKIISGIRVEKPSFYYTKEAFYGSRALNFIKTERFNYKYLTGFLNSQIVAFWLKYQGKLLGDLYQVDKEPLLNIPIFKADENIQKEIAEMVDKIHEYKKDLKNGIESSLEAIKIKYNLDNLPTRLTDFYKIGINPFKTELEQLGIEISLDKIEALSQWYKGKEQKFYELEKSISNLETEVNQKIYNFFNLTSEEVNIIEGS